MLLLPTILLSLLALTSAHEKCRVIRETMLSCLEASESDLPKTPSQKIQWVTFTKSKIPRVQRSVMRNFPKLTDFHAEDAGIERIDNDAFKTLAALNWIDVSRNHIKEIDVDLLSDAVSVDHFNISGNTELAIPKNKPILKSKTLKWLDISSCAIREVSAQTFEQLPSLRDLSLAHNLLKTLPNDVFKNNRGLLSLDLTDNKISHLPGTIFTGMRTMVIRFEDNPWNCDCTLTPLLLWSKRNVVKGEPKCEKPRNKKWKEIVNPPQCPA